MSEEGLISEATKRICEGLEQQEKCVEVVGKMMRGVEVPKEDVNQLKPEVKAEIKNRLKQMLDSLEELGKK